MSSVMSSVMSCVLIYVQIMFTHSYIIKTKLNKTNKTKFLKI